MNKKWVKTFHLKNERETQDISWVGSQTYMKHEDWRMRQERERESDFLKKVFLIVFFSRNYDSANEEGKWMVVLSVAQTT